VAFAGVIGAAVRPAKADEWLDSRPSRAIVPRARRRALPTARPSVCPEIDCLRALLPRRIIAAAEHRARSIGLGADRVLICADAITEEAYLTALASSLGTSYEPLDRVLRSDCPLDDNQLIEAAAAGLLPLREGGKIIWIVAPRRLTARRLADPRRSPPRWLQSFRLTSSERLWRFVARHAQNALGRRAADGLRRAQPLLSNAPRPRGWRSLAATAFVILAVTILALVPAATIKAFAAMLCIIFLAAAALRLSSALHTRHAPRRSIRIDDDKLPTYTIICALYREASVVGDLVAAIRALDYPPEKLDVKFVVEADDRDTRRALALLDLGPPFEIITAPPIGPRTKPKALNVALPLARGSFTVVYDAEDAPEPDQLRRALDAFMASDDRLACLQASLTIDNTADNWLARMFTANYAGQFDVLLPGLAALRLPFPLGGSSNHFRTSVLRKVGGWDPYNVTEDADLGIRLYRLGYRAAALSSATYEEAPARFLPWLKQRTRWYKGWMQTWLVHTRRPRRLMRELTPAGAIAFQLFLTCNVFAALVHPFFMAGLCYSLLAQPPLRAVGAMGWEAPMFVATFLGGYASTIALDLVGLRRRALLAHAWVLALTPLYWFLLSLAAWRALFQLVRNPQRWEKTEHGLAKNSRITELRRRKKTGNGHSPITPMRIMKTATAPLMHGGDGHALFRARNR
jgi:cellulose synthase/poly-beta-1,6-N-acetylglucosamine synthase-like glycosyltransferase